MPKDRIMPVTETENHIFCEKSLFGYVYVKLFDIKLSIWTYFSTPLQIVS